jgi:hypothetical protein
MDPDRSRTGRAATRHPRRGQGGVPGGVGAEALIDGAPDHRSGTGEHYKASSAAWSRRGPGFPGGDRKFAPPSPTPSRGKRIGFDFKTDYDVDVEKFLPTEGYPLYAPNANGNQQNVSAQKKKPFFMGLSVTKPLN